MLFKTQEEKRFSKLSNLLKKLSENKSKTLLVSLAAASAQLDGDKKSVISTYDKTTDEVMKLLFETYSSYEQKVSDLKLILDKNYIDLDKKEKKQYDKTLKDWRNIVNKKMVDIATLQNSLGILHSLSKEIDVDFGKEFHKIEDEKKNFEKMAKALNEKFPKQ